MYNSLKYTQKLEQAGFTRPQAEATVNLVVDSMEKNFATKSDVQDLRHEMQLLKSDLRADMKQFKTELKSELLISLGGIMVAGITILGFLQR